LFVGAGIWTDVYQTIFKGLIIDRSKRLFRPLFPLRGRKSGAKVLLF